MKRMNNQKNSNSKNNNCEISGYPSAPFKVIDQSFPDNLYLAQNKFFYKIKFKEDKNNIIYSVLYHQIQSEKNKNEKNKPSKEHHNLLSSKKYRDLLSVLNKRTLALVKSHSQYECVAYKPQTRLMIGTGGESPYNTFLHMTLHQIYGFPYIPATAIKGCLRNYLEQEKPEGLCIETLLGADSETTTTSKGCLVFFDTFPEEYFLAYDSLTPHNAEYFGGKEKAPSDMEKKIPLLIPCITKDSSFKIHIVCTNNEEWKKNGPAIITSLKNALCEYGLGAKTAFGYGLAEQNKQGNGF